MRNFLREHRWAVVVSVLLHGLLVVGLVFATLNSHRAPLPVQPLPIDAVVVDSQVLHAAQRAQSDQEAARARAAAEAQAAAAAKAADEARAAEEAKTAEQAKAAEQTKEDEQAKAAEQQRLIDAKKADDAKQAAESKQAAEAKQAADAKRAADERARADREAELRKQLADEEHRSAVESGPLRDSYIARLRNKIQSAWIKPPSASVGLDCLVEVTQIPGGEWTGARAKQCDGDAAARQPIEN